MPDEHRLAPVVLEVSDVDRSAKLYGDAFGLHLHRRRHRGDLDIPRLEMSSGGSEFVVGPMSPGDGLVVGGVVCEAAVEDTDEAVAERA